MANVLALGIMEILVIKHVHLTVKFVRIQAFAHFVVLIIT